MGRTATCKEAMSGPATMIPRGHDATMVLARRLWSAGVRDGKADYFDGGGAEMWHDDYGAVMRVFLVEGRLVAVENRYAVDVTDGFAAACAVAE